MSPPKPNEFVHVLSDVAFGYCYLPLVLVVLICIPYFLTWHLTLFPCLSYTLYI